MKTILTICVLIFGICQTANADIWKWVDANGKTHFVSTMKPIYTWIDEFEKVHYADKPEHEDAIAVPPKRTHDDKNRSTGRFVGSFGGTSFLLFKVTR